ncbi:phosphatase PAP2 family protein [Candidatus Pacearchaeota archaeon]|nr:phosphatase PAP2 family protein [Candidatus Pacearchaeota archaeon]
MSIKTFWKNSATNKLIIIVTIFWIVLAVVFGIYDLLISKFLFDPDSTVGNLVEAFGEIPGLLFIIFSLFVLNTNAKIKNKTGKKLFFVFEILLSSFSFIYILRLIFNYFNIPFKFASLEGISVFLGFALVSLIGFYLFKTKLQKFSEKNYLFAKVSLILFIISGILVEAFKFLWGRVRYEEVINNLGNFTEWYLPQGISGGNSFPSGHAYLAWIIIPLFLIFLHKNKIHKWIAIILVTLFALFISYERIVIGAHYTSDILFSGGIVIMIFLILYKKYFLNKDKKQRKSASAKKKTRKNKKQ